MKSSPETTSTPFCAPAVTYAEMTTGVRVAILNGSLLMAATRTQCDLPVLDIATRTADALNVPLLVMKNIEAGTAPEQDITALISMLSGVKRYSHAYTIAFDLHHTSPDGQGVTTDDLLLALQRRINYLRTKPEELEEACGLPYDTYQL